MRVTTQAMRENVKGWLEEEKATQEQTVQILNAIYGGVIDGDNYHGRRNGYWSDPIAERFSDIDPAEDVADIGDYCDSEAPLFTCGCLLDTLERIRDARPTGTMGTLTSRAFWLALKIPFGATPFDNAWSKAAAQGVEDYYQERGWK